MIYIQTTSDVKAACIAQYYTELGCRVTIIGEDVRFQVQVEYPTYYLAA